MEFGEARPLCPGILAFEGCVASGQDSRRVTCVDRTIMYCQCELDATILCLSRNDALFSRIQLGWLHTDAFLQLLERLE